VRAEEPPPIFDKRPYAEAKAAAERDGKWFIVKGTAVWCGPCREMDRTTWRDDKVVAWLKENAVVVALDVDKQDRIASDLRISAMPTMIAFNGGKEIDRVVGLIAPGEFLRWLKGMPKSEKAIDAVRAKAHPKDGGKEVDVDARLTLARTLQSQNDYTE